MEQLNDHRQSAYSDYLDRTRAALLDRLVHVPAGDVLHAYFERGKMLRAFLVFASADAVGGDPANVIKAAEAIEMLHTASLFHDDIIDQAAKRRGLVALHERLGVGPALVLGDDLLLRAFAALSETHAHHAAERVLEAMTVLNHLARECCRGQFDEMCAERWISEDAYFTIIRAKTAAPFVAAGALGAILGGGTREQIDRIRSFAHQIGIAFQIADDLLDLVGNADALGKPVGNSLARGRPMLPLIYLGKINSGSIREKISQLEQDCRPRDELANLLQEYGILNRVRQVQKRFIGEADQSLEGPFNFAGVAALRTLTRRIAAMTSPGNFMKGPGTAKQKST